MEKFPTVSSSAPSPVGSSPTIASTPARAGAATIGIGQDKFDAKRQISVRVVTSEAEAECRFWVGLAGEGGRSPASLMEIEDIHQILSEAATAGIADAGPLMLSDAEKTPPRFIYLLPVPEGLDEASADTLNAWVTAGMQTIRSWAPQSVGFYIAPELVQTPQSHTLLLALLTELIEAGVGHDFYLLVGSYGLNTLVNAALRLKAQMQNDLVNLHVYH